MKTLPIPSAAPKLDRTYWVLYGELLAGAYAGQSQAEAHIHRLNGLFQEGVRSVINLMESHEKNNYGQPFTPYEKQFQEIAARAGEAVKCYRFPIVDQSITTTEQMTKIVDTIDQSLSEGLPVYVHSFGGIGRTGTVVCCWLLRHGVRAVVNHWRRSPATHGTFAKTAYRWPATAAVENLSSSI